ncbi:MAG: PKD domain-containing protein [Bacteroidota bacterium]
MKKLFFTLLAVFAASFMFGQIVVNADITTNTTWTANNRYELKNIVFVTNGATLTIEPGTVIMGDSATKGTLVITPGSKIYAVGSVEKPIVFTSNQPAGSRKRGSWGGLVLLGNAKINVPGGTAKVEGITDAKGTYGGNDDDDSSGVLKYIRIEFAGVPLNPNQEINSLTLAGVGRKTSISHIMVTEAFDDSYEWFGGTVNAKYLIANRGWDDDFDTDFGFTGKVQFGVVVRDPAIADPGSGSSSFFESDNDGAGSTNTPQTAPVFSNITVIGPLQTSSTTINTNYVRAAQLRRNTALSLFNSVVTGYPRGIMIDGSAAAANATAGSLDVRNTLFAGIPTNQKFYTNQGAFDAYAWGGASGKGNDSVTNSSDINVVDQTTFSALDLRPNAGSPALTGAAFADAKLQGGFFSTTTYRGAFAQNDTWADCWCKWDAQGEDYTNGINYTAAADFTVNVNGATVSVTNNSTNATSYSWNFGDPNSTNDVFTVQSPAPYTYTSNGTYNITLVVRNGNCPPKTITKSIQITSLVSQTVVVAGDITANTTWTSDKIYELKNIVFVTNNAELTIQPGTIIKGDSATKGTLVITRGSKLFAIGTKTQPIVFTSNQPAGSRKRGSWGGVVLLGRAAINVPGGTAIVEGITDAKGTYGGNDDADNSGELKYVRIEYAGVPLNPNQEINSLTLGGVGSGTKISYIQVTEAFDDSYEWFGGTVDGKYLICNRGWDDDFDTDFGFRGKVQFGVVLRDPAIADPGSGSSASFESDNDGAGSSNTPQTSPVFSNITVVGPRAVAGQTVNSNYVRALQIRRNSATSVFNSAFAGYTDGLFIDGSASSTNATNGTLAFKNNIMAGFTRNFRSNTASFDINTWAKTTGFNNDTAVLSTDLRLSDPYTFANPDLKPTATSPLLTGASFADAKLQNSFFTTTTYRGAFAQNDTWTDCWTKWDPQGETYNSAINYVKATAQGNGQVQFGGYTYKFTNSSLNADKYLWDFGNGDTDTAKNPTYTFPSDGPKAVKLIAFSGCGNDSTTINITVVNVPEVARKVEALVYPNPAQNIVNVEFNMPVMENVKITVTDITGKTVVNAYEVENAFGRQNLSLNTGDFNNGVYFINISTPTAMGTHKFVIIK